MAKITDEQKFNKAVIFNEMLMEISGSKTEMLGKYRKWLDGKGIESEGEDGFPNEEAYKRENYEDFLKDIKLK